MMKRDDLGHVLFFDTKPVCFGGVNRRVYSNKLLFKGWQCWKKREALFPHPNFLFIEEGVYFKKGAILHIFAINKTALKATLYKHEALFKEILGPDFSPEGLIASIEEKKVIRPLINDDEALFGIILGFGAESPQAFKEKHLGKPRFTWAPPWTDDYTGIEVKRPKGCTISPVAFMGNPQSEEVIQLKKCYAQELKEIWEKYKSSPDLLKMTLNQLCNVEKERVQLPG